jgi:hypothetical protein
MTIRLLVVFVALLAVVPASAQVATVPVHSLRQSLTGDVKLMTSVSIYGYTSRSPIPRVLQRQTVKLRSISLLQPEFRAEFPGLKDAEMTVMQLVVNSKAEAPTFSSDSQTITPKTPLSIKVPPGQKLWVVYTAPVGQPGALRFYVGSPPPA